MRELGHGAYGTVISAQDEISGEHIAIKQVERVFDKPSLAKRALREITLLRHFSDHENITGLIDMDATSSEFNEIYLFMEPMEADLHQIIRSGQSLTSAHLQYFIYQILCGLKYIHSAGVIHRDLKPGNLLVNSNCQLKICDFGLSRGFDDTAPEDEATQLTEYVATRWYRAPEIMLSFKRYGKAIDLWSLGCILAELLMGKPLFKGKDYVDQLNKILDVLGTPDENMIQSIKSEKAQKYVRSLPRRKSKSLSELMPMADPQAIDLLNRLLQYDPDTRPDAVGTMHHPWLEVLCSTGESAEPDCPRKFERWKEVEELETLEEYRAAIWNEIQQFRREVRGILPSRRISRLLDEPVKRGDILPPANPANPANQPPPLIAEHTEELIEAMEGLDITRSPEQQENEEVPDELHGSRRLATLPETEQADVFEDDAQQTQEYSRVRKDSVIGGRLLRSLSTISVHEVTGGDSHQLYSKAAVGQYILEKSAADAPPSERPKEFA